MGHGNRIIVLFSETANVIWVYFFDNIFYKISILLNGKVYGKYGKQNAGKKNPGYCQKNIDHIAEFLEWNNISFSLFHGAMTNQQKDESIEAFKNKTQVLVTTEIGGEGRNMQFCSRMINYDLPWNPMKIEQRIGRIHRIGQEKEVRIFNFCAAGSIEDYILDVLDRKINMFEMVIGEIDMILGRIVGEKEFSDMVLDLWVNSSTEQDRKKSFTEFLKM